MWKGKLFIWIWENKKKGKVLSQKQIDNKAKKLITEELKNSNKRLKDWESGPLFI